MPKLQRRRTPHFVFRGLPRQAEHYSQIVGHFLAVKSSRGIAAAIRARFERLQKYHRQLLGSAVEIEDDSGED